METKQNPNITVRDKLIIYF